MNPRIFRIAVQDAAIADLRRRLNAARWPDEPADAGWRYGTELGYLGKLAAFWQESFDWRAQEEMLNRLPHYLVEIDGQPPHFIHLAGSGRAPRPLLLLHGWPSSFLEFLAVAEPLAHPERHGGDERDAFDVVIASLPGFTFSTPLKAPLGPRAMAAALRKLMTEGLGYRRFLVHGGDWGSLVASWLALDHAETLAGLHLSTLPLDPWTGQGAPPLSPEEEAYRAVRARHWPGDAAIEAITATKPQSLAFGLADSPIGLAGFLVDQLRSLADTGGNIERRLSKQQICTWLSLYWFTGCIASAAWLHGAGKREKATRLAPGQRVLVPTGYAGFAAPDTPRPPRSFAARAYDILSWQEMAAGGRFPALEEPEAFIASLRAFNARL